MSLFVNKIALITGAGSGIGHAIATRFREEGALVFTAQRSDISGFETIQADLTTPEAPEHIIRKVIAKTGCLDLLVNNAGMMLEASVENTRLEDWQRTLDLNLTAPFLLTKHAMPHLRASKGVIINIGSIEGLGANPEHPAYAASKAGLHGLTRAIAVDHGVDGVRCNTIAPGWIDTDLNLDFIAQMPDPETFKRRLSTIHPIGRTGTPEDVANLAAFLASDEAAFITGQTFTIDGGRMTKLSLPS